MAATVEANADLVVLSQWYAMPQVGMDSSKHEMVRYGIGVF